MKKILIDVGSSTVKVYKYFDNDLNLVLQRSLYFKESFYPEGGINPNIKKEFFELLEAVKDENKGIPIKIYATGIFRKLVPEARINFIDEVFLRTGLYFNIIDQELENFYLEMALIGKCDLNEPLLLINIGGGSTELVVMYGKEAIERLNLDFGVGKIIADFPEINEEISKINLYDIVERIKNYLPLLKNKPKIAFYTGGELNYMRLANYPLKKNKFFEDKEHPVFIEFEDFKVKNKEIFEKITLKELENLMPENPNWMHGARPCSAIAQAICERYNIKEIIPSDSNLINGVVRQEFRHVTLSGSFRKHLNSILEVKNKLEAGGGNST
jgi:exopolyphosphatase/pppGpp-phosphohydrolase